MPVKTCQRCGAAMSEDDDVVCAKCGQDLDEKFGSATQLLSALAEARDSEFERIRDVAFDAIKASLGCERVEFPRPDCERANCACAKAADAVASALID